MDVAQNTEHQRLQRFCKQKASESGLTLPAPLSQSMGTEAGSFEYLLSGSGGPRRQQGNTLKNCLASSVWLRVFKGKSGHYSKSYVTVRGWGQSVVLHGAVPLATWSPQGVSNPGTKMGGVWKEC